MFRFTQILSLALMLAGFSATAQTYHIRGKVASDDGETVPYANVLLSRASDSTLIKAVTTNTDGAFDIPMIPDGEYSLMISFIGFEKHQQEKIEVKDADIKLKQITLSPSTESLDEVTVTGEKPLIEIRPDKTVYNVKQLGGAAGLSGLEVLRSSPGVVIDNNNNIIVEGKQGVQIWIDGKPSILAGTDLTQYLQSLRASDIEAIEIITQPSSKYDASGTAGIINIRLKRDGNLGTNGSISTGVGYGRYGKWNNALTLNSRSKRVSFFGSYSNNFAKTFNYIDARRTIADSYFNMESEQTRQIHSHNFKASMDVALTDKMTIGIQANGTVSGNDADGGSKTWITQPNLAEPNSVLVAGSDTWTDASNYNFNGNFSYRPAAGALLTADLDYGIYTSDARNDQPNTYYNEAETEMLTSSNFRIITPLQVQLISGKIDYEQKLTRGKIAFGGKIVEVATDNTFDFYEEESGQLAFQDTMSNQFTYTEFVMAGYVNYSYNTKKWGFQVGLRAEQTNSLGQLNALVETDQQRVKREYLNLFPSAGFTYKPNKTNAFALNFSRRINRPNYQSLNPFQYRISEIQYRIGNPFLQPNYTNSVKISHTYKYAVTTSLSYSYRTDFNAQVTDTLDFETTFLQPKNVANEEVYSLSISSPVPVAKWWNMYFSLTGSFQRYLPYDDSFTKVEVPTFNFFGKSTFTLPGKVNFEISGWFNSPSVWGRNLQNQKPRSTQPSHLQKIPQRQTLRQPLRQRHLLHLPMVRRSHLWRSIYQRQRRMGKPRHQAQPRLRIRKPKSQKPPTQIRRRRRNETHRRIKPHQTQPTKKPRQIPDRAFSYQPHPEDNMGVTPRWVFLPLRSGKTLLTVGPSGTR